MEKLVVELLEKFLNHYENREIRKTYKDGEWTHKQIAEAFVKNTTELKELKLHNVSESEFVDRLINEEDFADKYLESVNYPKDLIEKGIKEVAKMIEDAKKKHSR